MSHIKQVTKWIVNIFTCLLFIILILIIYGKLMIMFTDKKYPNYFGYTLFEVASGSMEPTLHINDVILVKITKEDLKKDDIIAFYGDNAIITHRIVFIDGDKLTVKGDNNNTVDKPITKDKVIGKVVKIYNKLGIWKKVFTEPKILAILFITLLLFDFALSYNGEDKKKIEKIEEENKDNDEIVVKKVENKLVEPDKILELTRKIDIEEVNDLLNNPEIKLEKEEVVELKEKIENKEEKIEEVVDNLNEKEKKFIEYTVRLDLSEIMKNIDKKVQ